ncbi:unnamed protein product [Knipowitschia caucasica]
MHQTWCALFLLLSGTQAFLIHNLQRSLCLEEVSGSGEVVGRECSLDSDSQQWLWEDRTRLVNVQTSRCLSARHLQPVLTEACPEAGEQGLKGVLEWDCDRERLISRNNSLLLSLSGRKVLLTDDNKNVRWKSLDQGDICQETLRSRRASEEFEDEVKPTLSAEEKDYLRWFYRTEENTYWKYAILGFAFVGLLIGFMLLGMGSMANKNRKKVAKYKAVAALLQKKDCELNVALEETVFATPTKPLASPALQAANGELSDCCKPGNIMLTYKDGNTSSLYPDVAEAEADRQAEGSKEEEGEKGEPEITTAAKPDKENEEVVED